MITEKRTQFLADELDEMRRQGLFRRLRKLLGQGVLTSEISASFPPEEIKAAVERAQAPGRTGKVLLKFSASTGERGAAAPLSVCRGTEA